VTSIMVEVGDHVQRTGDGRIGRVFGGRTIERSGDAVCGLHRAREDEEHGFLGWDSKLRSMVCQWFSLKTTGTVCQWFDLKTTSTISPGLTSKSWWRVSRFRPQNR
jgi:hypothetical protein